MNLQELLTFIDLNSDLGVLDGDVAETLSKARASEHSNGYMGEVVAAIADGCGIGDDTSATFERTKVVNSMAQVRLKYMADDAPVDGFRQVEKFIHGVDGAFNAEAIRLKNQES